MNFYKYALSVIVMFLFANNAFLFAQSNLNVTGRVSLRATNTSYDETSEIKPDSIPESEYGKTSLIPGLQQNVNLALFARTSALDLTLLGDIRNNEWNQFELADLKTINRLSLSARFGNNEIVVGDFFETQSELFIQSREIRGARGSFRFEDLWNPDSYVEWRLMGGITEKAFGQGNRLINLYKQFETTGQFRRYFASSSVTAGQRGSYYIGLHYLQGKDDKNSIDESLNDPLANQSLGGNGGLYLFNNRLQIYGEGYLSRLDTLDSGDSEDHAFKAGYDLRLERFKMVTFYQRLGYNYYSSGYPFLLNDREGFKTTSAYYLPEISTITVEIEQYEDNLEQLADRPTTETRLLDIGLTTNFNNFPEFTVRWGYRDDKSNTVIDEDDNPITTDKISRKYEGRIGLNVDNNRFSLSTIYIDLDDNSQLAAGSPLGTEQLISSMNIYARPTSAFYLSGGIVYSKMLMTNAQENDNLYIYESSRWDILDRKLKFESTLTYINNNASNGGIDDMLSDYWQIFGEVSLEYFFNSSLSLKLVGGTDTRHMYYSVERALEVIGSEYGPLFFNSNEAYDAVIYGLELNWIF